MLKGNYKNYIPQIYCKNIALFVQKDEQIDGNAFLGVGVLHPTMNKNVTTYLTSGNRKELLEYINSKDFLKEFEETVIDLSESLKND